MDLRLGLAAPLKLPVSADIKVLGVLLWQVPQMEADGRATIHGMAENYEPKRDGFLHHFLWLLWGPQFLGGKIVDFGPTGDFRTQSPDGSSMNKMDLRHQSPTFKPWKFNNDHQTWL